ncbi:probable serine/threonine-protein kinase dyrk2 isoform X2 [Asparagus officinalis]|uniref:probable serine/threonine-protein kinase dyrk2 isoform X2 n=1 Tax=Asparagus officinalis TaxID=4686 RepID=UPI00098E427D|nr:probable serine/threonine-protein kinase dyrk2 isoform X2 [Asparagus officinalis]
MEELSLIDVSSEDDVLLSSSIDCQRDLRSSGFVQNHDGHDHFVLDDAHEGGNLMKVNKQWENIPEISESPEQKRAKSGNVNLRKSLAWDSAFFTSEGVLNTEELAIVNSTFRKTELCSLPGIAEELRTSAESTSTLDSESYKLENIEGDLFGNIRASIQLSRSKTRKKIELPSQTKMKPPAALRMNKQQPGHTSKKFVIDVKEAGKATRDSKLSSKPPRVVPKPTSSPTIQSNKDSSGRIQPKNNTWRTSSGSGPNRQGIISSSKISGDSRNKKPNPVSSTALSLSRNSQVSSSSNLAGKSPAEATRKSPVEATRKQRAVRNSGQSLSTSASNTPVRASKRKLVPSNINQPPMRANSIFKFSSRASPSSSIDSVVSEVSSSTSTSIKPSNSVESLGSSSSSSPSLRDPIDTKVDRVVAHQPCIQKEISHVRRSMNNNAGGAKGSKPSGLRMPSPKIGYFDAEKTLPNNSNKISQVGLRNSLLKGNSGSSNTVGANKLKSSKIPSIKPPVQLVSMNFHSSQAQSTPLSSQMMSPASPRSIHQQSKPAQVHKDSSPVTSESCISVACKGAVNAAAQLQVRPVETSDSGVVHNGTAAPCQFDNEEKHTQLTQKENLSPANETNCSVQQSPSECQKMSVVDIMDKKMSSLSLSETADLVGGD